MSTGDTSRSAKGDIDAADASSSTGATAKENTASGDESANQANDGTSSSEPAAIIERGWAVQVGVFTDSNGAKRVVEDLRAKGFAPKTTIVDTNKGKATGTRVWLGPYESRVSAAKAKANLTEKTGESGFIRAYP